jgi:hypothetical protein
LPKWILKNKIIIPQAKCMHDDNHKQIIYKMQTTFYTTTHEFFLMLWLLPPLHEYYTIWLFWLAKGGCSLTIEWGFISLFQQDPNICQIPPTKP